MKRRASGGEMNLDSLLDTLTNVVGVLVMVLMLVSLNVQKAVQRIREIDPSQLGVSEAELAKMRTQAEEVTKKRSELEKLADAETLAKAKQELVATLDRINILRLAPPTAPPPSKINLAEIRKDAEEKSKKAADLAKQLTDVEKELARLKALLAETPELGPAPPAKLVSLPNPREAPPGAKQHLFICRGGKVMAFDPNDLRDRAKKRAEAMLKPLRAKAGPNGNIDCEKFIQQFNSAGTISDSTAKMRLGVENFNLYIYYEYRSSGETARQLAAQNSDFRRTLRRLNPAKDYATFLVWNDSFETYVEARRICDEMGLLAGWTPLAEDYVYKVGLGISVPCEGRPPPPPNTGKAPSGPSAAPPPVPNDVVD
jgi:Asp-tRNA(Asn)/Glu-tRNA(Gln) amidotransferase C subunit